MNRANCLFSLERFGEAVNSYRRAVDVSPLFPEGWVSRAVAEQRLGLSADAVSSFQMFLGLADQQKHRETVQKANQSLKELSGLGFRMKDPQTFLWMVKGYRLVAEQKQFDKAIPCFDNALAQVTDRVFTQWSWEIFPCQISGADEEREAFGPRVVGGFALGLDVEIDVFHTSGLPSPLQGE